MGLNAHITFSVESRWENGTEESRNSLFGLAILWVEMGFLEEKTQNILCRVKMGTLRCTEESAVQRRNPFRLGLRGESGYA